jgi:colanic acid/amylovoran biosynthesis glycosyltransferase
MKILLCIGSYKTRVSGPAVVAEQFFSINDTHPEHESHILTNDTDIETPLIHKLKMNYPKQLGAFDFLMRNYFYYKEIKVLQQKKAFDVIVFGDIRCSLLTRFLLPKSIKIMGIIHDYLSANARISMHGTRRRYLFFRYFVRYFEQLSARYSDAIIVGSEDLRQRIIKAYSIDSQRITTLSYGFDVQNIPFKIRENAFQSPIKILFIKSNLRSGGMDILVSALKELNAFNFILTVIGPPHFLKNDIENLIKNASNIQLRFLGFQTQSDVNFEMHNNDILCTPSRVESLGLANVEGLATGISVVSTREGGITEVLDGGNNGWLAEPENVEDLARKLKICIESDSSVRAEKSRLGRQFVEKRFDYRQFNALFLSKCAELMRQ